MQKCGNKNIISKTSCHDICGPSSLKMWKTSRISFILCLSLIFKILTRLILFYYRTLEAIPIWRAYIAFSSIIIVSQIKSCSFHYCTVLQKIISWKKHRLKKKCQDVTVLIDNNIVTGWVTHRVLVAGLGYLKLPG